MVLRKYTGIKLTYSRKNLCNYKRVRPNQFVIHLRSFQGGFAYSDIDGIASPAYTVIDFKNKEKHEPTFWKYFFMSDRFIRHLESVTYGIRDGRSISFRDFGSLKLKYPDFKEQMLIGEYLDKIDFMITLHQRAT